MSITLGNLVYRVLRACNVVTEGVATGGATTTIIDTVERTEADDFWNKGSAIILKDAAGASAAPEGEIQVISDFVNSTGVITLRTALTVAVASGDIYAIARSFIPLRVVISKINAVLSEDIGYMLFTDKTSLTIAANQTEYSLPAACYELREVWLQGDKSDSDDNLWSRVYGWRVETTATGTADLLILPYQYGTDYDLKLEYMGVHPELYAYSDKLAEGIAPERVIYPAALGCLEWRRAQSGYWDDWDKEMARLQVMIETVQREKPPRKVRPQGRLMIVGRDGPLAESTANSVVIGQ